MAPTEAQKRATKKWREEKTDEVRFRVPKGEKELFFAHASQMGETPTAFLHRAAKETMERDTKNK